MKKCTIASSRKISGLHFTTTHIGKMAGIGSITTSVRQPFSGFVLAHNSLETLQGIS